MARRKNEKKPNQKIVNTETSKSSEQLKDVQRSGIERTSSSASNIPLHQEGLNSASVTFSGVDLDQPSETYTNTERTELTSTQLEQSTNETKENKAILPVEKSVKAKGNFNNEESDSTGTGNKYLNNSDSLSIRQVLERVVPYEHVRPNMISRKQAAPKISQVRMDPSYFTSCSGVLNQFAMSFTAIILLICILEKRCTEEHVNTGSNSFTNGSRLTISRASRQLSPHVEQFGLFRRTEQCLTADALFFLTVFCLSILFIFVTSYLFRVVSVTSEQIPWLTLEYLFYLFFSFSFIISSTIVSNNYNTTWFKMVTWLTIGDSFIFLIQFFAKFSAWKLGYPAQSLVDPDGDEMRRKWPNQRFQADLTKNIEDVKRVWKV